MSWTPFLLALVPPQGRKIKLDRSLVYPLGLAIWALVWILVASSINPDTFEDECAEGGLRFSAGEWYFYIVIGLNIVIAIISVLVMSVASWFGDRRRMGPVHKYFWAYLC